MYPKVGYAHVPVQASNLPLVKSWDIEICIQSWIWIPEQVLFCISSLLYSWTICCIYLKYTSLKAKGIKEMLGGNHLHGAYLNFLFLVSYVINNFWFSPQEDGADEIKEAPKPDDE